MIERIFDIVTLCMGFSGVKAKTIYFDHVDMLIVDNRVEKWLLLKMGWNGVDNQLKIWVEN